MRALDKARLRIRSLFWRRKVESELENELRFHLDQLVEEADDPVRALATSKAYLASQIARSFASRSLAG